MEQLEGHGVAGLMEEDFKPLTSDLCNQLIHGCLIRALSPEALDDEPHVDQYAAIQAAIGFHEWRDYARFIRFFLAELQLTAAVMNVGPCLNPTVSAGVLKLMGQLMMIEPPVIPAPGPGVDPDAETQTGSEELTNQHHHQEEPQHHHQEPEMYPLQLGELLEQRAQSLIKELFPQIDVGDEMVDDYVDEDRITIEVFCYTLIRNDRNVRKGFFCLTSLQAVLHLVQPADEDEDV